MSVRAVRMSPSYSVLRHADASSIVFRDERGPITATQFLADVAALAAALPEDDYVVNLCTNRYRFTVALIAALQRRQVTLLPMSDVPTPLAALAQEYRRLYVLVDEPVAPMGLRVFRFPTGVTHTAIGAIPEFPSEQPAVVLFTSGSTGAPVPYPRSWGALNASTDAAARRLEVADLVGASVLGTVPHQHSYGLESIIILSLRHGFTIHGTRPLLPADILAQLARMSAPRILVTTPIHLRSLVAHAEAAPPIDRILCATAPLTPDLARLAEDRFGAPLYEIYGCSEVGQIAVRRTIATLEWRCIDGIELREQDGDVWASGCAAATEAPLNDIIELKSPRRFLLHSRKSDVVNIAGKRSSLSFLNFQLNAIDGVRDGVFMVPADAASVTRLTAYVVAPGLSSAEILAALRRVLDPAFLPRPLYILDALPRNSLGKLSRHAMEQLTRAVKR